MSRKSIPILLLLLFAGGPLLLAQKEQREKKIFLRDSSSRIRLKTMMDSIIEARAAQGDTVVTAPEKTEPVQAEKATSRPEPENKTYWLLILAGAGVLAAFYFLRRGRKV